MHGFSHLLLSALALECGYPASSIRSASMHPRRYGVSCSAVRTPKNAGGLIQVADVSTIRAGGAGTGACASKTIRVRAADPENSKASPLHERLARLCFYRETSCEQQNDFLDGALVVKRSRLGANCSATPDVINACLRYRSRTSSLKGACDWRCLRRFWHADWKGSSACRIWRRFHGASADAAPDQREGLSPLSILRQPGRNRPSTK